MFDIWLSVAPFFLALFGAIVGGLVSNHFASKREKKVIKREIALKYIVEAIDIIDGANSARQNSDIKNVEKAVNRIQIFGSKSAIQATEEYMNDLNAHGSISTSRILNTLRDDIRKDLSLEESTTPFFYIAFRKD